MATTTERINNLDTGSKYWVTKDQEKAGRKYLIEKHAREGAAKTRQILGGIMSNAEDEAALNENAKNLKRQRESELGDALAEMQKAAEEGSVAKPKPAFPTRATPQDAKPKRAMPGLLVVKKAKVSADGGEDAEAEAKAQEADSKDGAAAGAGEAGAASASSSTGESKPEAAATASGSGGGISLGAYGSSSEEEDEDDEEEA
eukprot:TRINITY_DN81612_c0_g1_i1.p1 TRINITY_DN81612_c0_g1~~TRINITY_DN81612_c0_g1_i1.p1  ORF type:complete len:202 (-),score=69.47 TRINITY_DN81612_c0_g1_i1:103-708(-)